MTGARFALAAVLALTIVAAAPGSAASTTLTCQVSGSGSFNPLMGPIDGSGRYALEAPAGLTTTTLCSYDGGPNVPSSLHSGGKFQNFVCGTAQWTTPYDGVLDDTRVDVGRDGSFEVDAMEYTLTLVGWQGQLDVRTVNGRPEQSARRVDGVLSFRPQHTCTFNPLARATFEGAFTLTW